MTKRRFFKPFLLATLLGPLAATSCDSAPEANETQALEQPVVAEALSTQPDAPNPERRGIGLESILATPQVANAPLSTPPFDPRRSLAVTDVPIVSQFSLKDVMDKIAGGTGLGLGLFQRLWATQGEACEPTINGFSNACRGSRGEGQEALNSDPFGNNNNGYMAIGLFNRFDLAPVDGANCGEYRIVFARRSGATDAFTRNFMIFEAVLPNPTPSFGLEGCRPVANFWNSLSAIDDIQQRAKALKTFYFQGLIGFAPVIKAEHFAGGAGQVRTNQFMLQPWSLREFKLQPGTPPSFKQVPVKMNPFFQLFWPSDDGSMTAFQNNFVSQIPSLRGANINTFTYDPPAGANGGQSNSQSIDHNYITRFVFSSDEAPFSQAMTNAGAAVIPNVPTLTRNQILNRATALSCAGCHQLSNGADVGNGMKWPESLQFVHISEQTELVPDGNPLVPIRRHMLSPALTSTFLPHRQGVLQAFLARIDSCTPRRLFNFGTLQPDSEAGKDASIVNLFSVNNGESTSVSASAWSDGGTRKFVTRSLIDFDLSVVDGTKSIVSRATLHLFGNGTHQGSLNGAVLSRITQPWNEHEVSWNTRPAVDMSQTVSLAASANASQDYALPVTTFITQKRSAPAHNHGFMLQLAAEEHHNQLNFHSSDSSVAARRPALDLMVTTKVCN